MPIYLGPMLVFLFGWRLLARLILVAKREHITSIADFIAARYGKSQRLAMVISLIAVMGILPYLVLQLKAIVTGLDLLMANSTGVSPQKRAVQSVVCGVLIGFICGFIGAGGGMMMLLILTSVLGYELKTAVGTSVFIMTFTALTGAVSHFMIGGAPDWGVWVLCVLFTLLWARIAAVFANKATPKTLNRATGVVLVVLGIVIMGFKLLA